MISKPSRRPPPHQPDRTRPAKGINRSYLCRVLRLTLFAPDLVEAILEGRQPERLTLKSVMQPMPEAWEEQMALFR